MDKFLKPCEICRKAEAACLLLMALCIPLNWRWASYVMVALCVAGCGKALCCRRQRKPLPFRQALPYLLYAATFCCYLLSVIWSDDQREAWRMVDKKLPFLLLPLCFLIAQPAVDGLRLRRLLWCFTGSTLAVFAANLLYAIYDLLFRGAGFSRFLNEQLLAIHPVHHTYMAMYACMGIAFCLFGGPGSGRRGEQVARAGSLLALSLFVVLLASRAGLLCMALLYIACSVRLLLRKRWKPGGALAVALVMAALLAGWLVPGSVDRVVQTVRSLHSQTEPDCRMVQRDAYRPLLRQSGWFGIGCGDRRPALDRCFRESRDALLQQVTPAAGADSAGFAADRQACMDSLQACLFFYSNLQQSPAVNRYSAQYRCDSASVRRVLYRYLVLCDAVEKEYNTHNQYEDTLVAVGWTGLFFMLLYFLMPVAGMLRRREWDALWLCLLFVVAFNALFESVFEKQNGILFFLFLFFLFHQKNSRIADAPVAGGGCVPDEIK